VLRKLDENNVITTKIYGGHKTTLWGAEDYESRIGRYGCLTVDYNNDYGDKINFLEFFANSFREKIFDFGYFYGKDNQNRVKVILDIAKGKMDGFDENDTLDIAELIKYGFLSKDGDVLTTCIPVYTPSQYEEVLSILDSVINKATKKYREIMAISMDILIQHTPVSMKKDAKKFNGIKRHDLAMAGPVEIMKSSGVLRRIADNERPTAYILLK
jgi:hypothetical protein